MCNVKPAVPMFLSAAQRDCKETDQVHMREQKLLFYFAFIYTLCYVIENNFIKGK
jgi:hypothetical protein